MKILVTGGCGFVGANLVPKLLGIGHEVKILDNMSNGDAAYVAGSDVEIIEGDIRDREAVRKASSGVDCVIHLAAFGSVIDSIADPEENFEVNVRGTFTVLDECRKNDIQQVIFSSTGGALMGDTPPPVNEKSVPRPISPYGASKLCGEAYCSGFAGSYGMNITALRFANVVGPVCRHKKGAVTKFINAVMNDEPIVIYGDGSATRDFLFVGDLCDGIIGAMDANLSGFNPFHLAKGEQTSILQLARMVVDISGKDDHEIILKDKRRGEVEKNSASNELAREKLGFKPNISLKEALVETYNWFRETR